MGVGMPFHATVASVGSNDCVTQVIYIIIIIIIIIEPKMSRLS